METLDIKIALDPVNDGAVLKETKLKRKDEGALIIATNGESRIVDAYEAQEILDKLNDIGHGEYMGDSDYIAMMNGDKIINIGTGKCFIGVRPFLSDKYDLTQHPKYPLTADADKRNRFDIEKFLDHNLILKPDDQYEVIEINED